MSFRARPLLSLDSGRSALAPLRPSLYIECFFSVNGTQIGESRNTVAVQAGQEATCHSDAASERRSGTYNVEFKTYGLADSHLWAEDGLWHFTTLPY